MRNCLIKKCVMCLLFLFCTYVPVWGDESSGETFVFFVQNTKYSGGKNLEEKSDYNKSVKDLYEVFLSSVNNSNQYYGCEKVENKTKKELLDKFGDFVHNNLESLTSNARLFIVLNGHGSLGKISKTYMFEAIDGKHVLLYHFISRLKEAFGESATPNVIFIVLTCRTSIEEKNVEESINESKESKKPEKLFDKKFGDFYSKLRHVIIYACPEERAVVITDPDKLVAIKSLTEALSGAADAEEAFAPNRGGLHDGEISLWEMWKYVEWKTEKLDKSLKPECQSFCRDKNGSQDNLNAMWFGVVSKVNTVFLKPSNFNPRIDHLHLYAIGGWDPEYKADFSDPYPKFLPEEYRYNFEDTNFKNGEYRYCIFENIDFSGAQFSSGALRNTIFRHCNLSGAKIGNERMNSVSTQNKENFETQR